MTIKPDIKDALWMVPGVALLILLSIMVFRYYKGQNTAEQLASKTKRAALVAAMRLDLASASIAEKSAVLAVAEKDSQAFADQARAAAEVVERKHRELADLLRSSGTDRERELLARFEKTLGDFESTDQELLSLAAKNTNTKAFNLAFGPAAVAVHDMEVALSRIGTPHRDQRSERLACGARIGALHILALLAPHIAEKSDQRMDEFEAQIAREDEEVKKALAALERSSPGSSLNAAKASYARFGELRKQILALSRENTNVRSLAISLDQGTKVMLTCQDALAALQQAIDAEPVAGLDYATPARPR